MGNLAGSGGYYIAMYADRILASPGTITGSIGVISGKFVAREAADRIGVGWDGVALEGAARRSSPMHPLDEAGRARMEHELDEIYKDFVMRAADGRKTSFEKIEPLARGRIWTGARAAELGLVDGVGGWREAESELARLCGVAEGSESRWWVLTSRAHVWNQLRGMASVLWAEVAAGWDARTRGIVELRDDFSGNLRLK
ncbi:MAG: S49 family peptidase [Bdellovibrionales bacterium]|nr:S49 family peptidase [Bdellovibrionales bacterium]